MLAEARSRAALLRWVPHAALLAALAALQGCYYVHVAAGQLDLDSRREPATVVIADPATPVAVRERLRYVEGVRRFAIDELGLPDNGSYTSYAELDRPYVAWNVFAAPEFSVRAKEWCFPVAGCVAYRGYFELDRAQRYADGLAARGYDVYVAPVAAYSTLGHFEDPVLSSMMRYDELSLAALIFHELAHQRVYVKGDSQFNEGYATVVELEGARRWAQASGRGGELTQFLEARRRVAAVAGLMIESRDRLEALYAGTAPGPSLREAKAREFERLRAGYEALRAGWGEGPSVDGLLDGELNNARLGAVATYEECVPGLTRLLDRAQGDLRAFHAAVERLAALTPAERRSAVCAG